MNCPSCRNPMEEKHLDAKYGGKVAIDLCYGCHGIWFDGTESLQLAPGAVLRLFRTIHDHHDDPRHPLEEAMSCPRCSGELTKTHDLMRNTRFLYMRCRENHGRFITFFQFLLEKNIVKSLDVRQLAELRRHVKVIKCSHCGGPVDLEKSMACGHCSAAISVLDPTAVEAALSELQKQELARSTVDPTLPMQLLADKLKTENFYAQLDARERARGPRAGWKGSLDLLDVGIDLVIGVMRRIL